MADPKFVAAVAQAITVTSEALQPWIASRIDEWPPDRNGRISPGDPSYQISVLLGSDRAQFPELRGEGLTLVQEYRHTRNRWAHHVPFNQLDAIRGLDTCRRLLQLIDSDRAIEVETAVNDVLRAASTPDPSAEVATGPRRAVSAPAGEHRRMARANFQESQWEHRYDPHVAPVNRLVDQLIESRDGSWMPYVAPSNGGIAASIVMLFQDPGPMTSLDRGGSGFLSFENDDPSAEVGADCLDSAGVHQHDITTWNAYPWFLPDQSGVNASRIDEGIEPLRQLLDLLPGAHSVVACGRVAQESWRRLARQDPRSAARLTNFETFHTSGRGITNGGRQTKADGIHHVVATLRAAASGAER